MTTYTFDEWREKSKKLFEKDMKKKWQFVCPECKTVQSAEDMLKIGVSIKEVKKIIGYYYIGVYIKNVISDLINFMC